MDRVETMEEISNSMPEDTVREEMAPAISLEATLGYLASLAESLDQISRRIKDDVNGLVLQASKNNPEENHQGDINDDNEEAS
tara:strand:+ start:277 stop:525 length:249 start_codon:yes stop_codon:yes gene_type:complete